MTTYYTTREWKALSTEQKLAFGAGNVRRVSVVRGGRRYTEWAVTR